MPRKPNSACDVTWENSHGTTSSGNLPQFKATNPGCGIDVGSITYPGVRLSDFRFYHIKCPYSTQSSIHLVRNMDIGDPNYFTMEDASEGPYGLVSHTSTSGVMIKEARGSVWGWVCVDDSCSYYTSTGLRYFYR